MLPDPGSSGIQIIGLVALPIMDIECVINEVCMNTLYFFRIGHAFPSLEQVLEMQVMKIGKREY
jgi:hypothetical protein